MAFLTDLCKPFALISELSQVMNSYNTVFQTSSQWKAAKLWFLHGPLTSTRRHCCRQASRCFGVILMTTRASPKLAACFLCHFQRGSHGISDYQRHDLDETALLHFMPAQTAHIAAVPAMGAPHLSPDLEKHAILPP